MSGPKILFSDWPYSPFCMKVRAILDRMAGRPVVASFIDRIKRTR